MSEAASSLDFNRLLEGKGLSADATHWLQKALHPAGASPVAVCIPDETRVPTVGMDFRPATVIKPPAGLTATDLWDVLIWSPPGDANAAFIVTAIAGTNFNTATTATVPSLTCRTLASQDPVTNSAYSLGKIFDTSTAGGAAVSILTASSSIPASLPVAFRTAYKSLTASLTASSLNNQGTVFATQFAREMHDTGSIALQADSLGFYRAAAAYEVSIPFDEATLNLISPTTETRPAKEGCYMPLRLNGPVQPFQTVKSWANRTCDNTYGNGVTSSVATALYGTLNVVNTGTFAAPVRVWQCPSIPCLPFPLVTYDGGADSALPYAGFIGSPSLTGYDARGLIANTASFDTGYDNTAHGVILFRGLSSQASVTLQCYVGLEVIPSTSSPIRAFVRTPCPPDSRAIGLYYDIANSMPSSYPSRYNSVGALLPYLVEAAKVVLPHLPAVIGWVADRVRNRPSPPAIEGPKGKVKTARKAKPVGKKSKPRK